MTSIITAGATDIGRKRKTNQDSIFLSDEQKLYVVADGMGGHNGGDIASQMSVKIFPEYFAKNKNDQTTPELLSSSIKHINNSIFEHAQKNEDLKGMGTTITSISVDEEYIYLANIGDSRAYMIQDSKLYQLTKDHSLVQEKLNLGIYDRAGAKKDPQKNILTKTVGFELGVEPDVFKYKMNKNDLFLLCSDGLHGKVSDPDILHIVSEYIPQMSECGRQELTQTVDKLIQHANINGGQDNISVILVKIV